MINIIIKKIREIFRRIVLKFGFFSKVKIYFNKNIYEFHKAHESDMLTEIAVKGFESYESAVVGLLKNYPFSVGTFIDGGANIGFYSVLASSIFEKADVIAVEPHPVTARYLRELRDRNKLNFKIFEAALDNHNGRKNLFFPTNNKLSKYSSIASLNNYFKGTDGKFNYMPYDKIMVNTLKLDSLLDDKNIPVIIKLDCEGNEFDILNSSKKIISRNNIDFIVEILIGDKNKNEVFELFSKNGYNAFLITNAGLVKENRPLTLPNPNRNDRTLWKNHFFSKKSLNDLENFSRKKLGNYI